MYKTINLLSPAIQEKQHNKQTIFSIVLAGLLGVACFGSLWFALKIQNADLDDSLGGVTMAVVSGESVALTSVSSQDALARVGIINAQAKKEIDWEKAFGTVNSLVDKEMVLSNYSLVGSVSGLSLKMAGFVPSNVDFANYVEFLKLSKNFTGVADGYSFDPTTGKVTFTVSGDIPLSQLVYEAKTK